MSGRPTALDRLQAVILVLFTSLIAALACNLALRLGWPVLAPVLPAVVGVAWGRGYFGGWLLPAPWRRWS